MCRRFERQKKAAKQLQIRPQRLLSTSAANLEKGELTMRYFKYLLLLGVLMAFPLVQSQAQVRVGVGIGFGPGYIAGPPACSYGYYDYAPYACAPYGYYGANWFSNGIFIGAGPWYHGFYGRGGWGYGGRGYYGRAGYGYGRGYIGGRGVYRGAPAAVFHGGAVAHSGGGFHGGGGRR
jgi:hypothetical protein